MALLGVFARVLTVVPSNVFTERWAKVKGEVQGLQDYISPLAAESTSRIATSLTTSSPLLGRRLLGYLLLDFTSTIFLSRRTTW